mgnify:CR=1 FL=1
MAQTSFELVSQLLQDVTREKVVTPAGEIPRRLQQIVARMHEEAADRQEDKALLREQARMAKCNGRAEGGPYAKLDDVLTRAYNQSANGKGKERHVKSGSQKFEDQPICTLQRIYGEGYAYGQVGKKMEESMRLPKDRAVAELLGAIVYLSAAIVVREEQ